MWLADGWKDYEVIDCSKGEKLERWGDYLLVRPDPQDIIIAAAKAAVSGNFLICRSSGRSIIKNLPLI